MPISHNDINMLQRSLIFARLAEGQGPQVNYSINGNNYSMSYYLADGIYPSWATFVKTIPEPQGNKKKYLTNAQKTCRKDVEHALRVLQSRFAIVRGLAQLWDESIENIMMAYITMHNMIIKDEPDAENGFIYDEMEQKVIISHDDAPELDAFIANYQKINDNETHTQLQEDLIEHLWNIIILIYIILVVMSNFIFLSWH
jgi:hypothetical protein